MAIVAFGIEVDVGVFGTIAHSSRLLVSCSD